jgi:hypothetical protein
VKGLIHGRHLLASVVSSYVGSVRLSLDRYLQGGLIALRSYFYKEYKLVIMLTPSVFDII